MEIKRESKIVWVLMNSNNLLKCIFCQIYILSWEALGMIHRTSQAQAFKGFKGQEIGKIACRFSFWNKPVYFNLDRPLCKAFCLPLSSWCLPYAVAKTSLPQDVTDTKNLLRTSEGNMALKWLSGTQLWSTIIDKQNAAWDWTGMQCLEFECIPFSPLPSSSSSSSPCSVQCVGRSRSWVGSLAVIPSNSFLV